MTLYANILTGGVNNHETTSDVANGPETDFVDEGVVGAITATAGVAPMTGGFASNEQGTPAMFVDVSAGTDYVDATPTSQGSQTLRVRSTATEAVTIAANSSGSTKYDWVYLTISAANAAAPNTAGDNVLTITTSRSTSASTDDGSPPTYAYAIAVVTVSNGATSIVDANITDKRVRTIPVPDGTVTNAKLNTTAGELGAAWADWTPTWTNLVVSGSTVTAKYIQIGKTVHIRVSVVLGGGNNPTGPTNFTLPVTSSAYSTEADNGVAGFLDAGVAHRTGVVRMDSTTVAQLVNHGVSGSYVIHQGISATVPHTWGDGDIIMASMTYEAA